VRAAHHEGESWRCAWHHRTPLSRRPASVSSGLTTSGSHSSRVSSSPTVRPPTSLTRRGPASFVRSRLLRLGVPLLGYVFLLQPLTDYIGNVRSERGSFAYYLGRTEVGVMWFVAALLAFSLAYAGLRVLRPAVEPGCLGQRPPVALLFAAVAAIAVGSFVVWQVWPLTADMFLNLRFGEWPQGAVLFALGVHAAETGWLDNVRPAQERQLGRLAAAAVITLVALFGAEVAWGDLNVLLDATSPGPTIVFAVLDGVLAVTWTLWCVAWFRSRWPSHGPVFDRVSRAPTRPTSPTR
jgi:glucans biosynthesis protein C